MALPGNDLEWLFGELAHTVRQGKPLAGALAGLARAEESTRRGKAADRLSRAVSLGRTLSAAVAEDAATYPPGTVAAVEAGERSGRLAEVLTTLCEHARMEDDLRHNLSRAIVYPVIISIGAAAAMIFIHIVIVPQFWQMFDELNVELPFMTTEGILAIKIMSVLLVFIPAGVITVLYLVTAPWMPWRPLLDALRVGLPVVGAPLRRLLLSRWCATAGMLFAAGVPEPKAVRLAGDSSGNLAVRSTSHRIADRIEAGTPLSQAMSRESFFPPVLSWMVGAAEQGGGHRALWPIVRDIYTDQARVETTVVAMVVGVFFAFVTIQLVGLTVWSLFLPLIKLMNSLGG